MSLSDKNVRKRNHEGAKGSLSLKELDCNPTAFATVRDSSSPAGTFELNGSKNAISNYNLLRLKISGGY